MENFYDVREHAAIAAANWIASSLGARLQRDGNASLVVTGGSSPMRCYEILADTTLAWNNVHVLLSDERWVPDSDRDSNERMVRQTLLVNRAAGASFLSFYNKNKSIEEQCEVFSAQLEALPRPFASTLLGMGGDGHIASLFADSPEFADGMDTASGKLAIAVSTPSSPHPRISLTLNALLQSDEIVLLFFADDKREVYEQAKLDPQAYPVSRLLHQERVPVHVFWAP
ncbi:MAG: 6-phosphogluconolactonase [Woeseiaceae bacterium]